MNDWVKNWKTTSLARFIIIITLLYNISYLIHFLLF